MNRRNDYIGLLEMANDELKGLGVEIKVKEKNGGYYDIDIVEKNDNNTTSYAENFYEDELADCISDAWSQAKIMVENKERRKALKDQLISFKIVNGWTHDMPALIYSLTSIDLYFHDFDTDNIEKVNAESIDCYAERNGEFCVHVDDYELAEQQIYEHDELGIEH